LRVAAAARLWALLIGEWVGGDECPLGRPFEAMRNWLLRGKSDKEVVEVEADVEGDVEMLVVGTTSLEVRGPCKRWYGMSQLVRNTRNLVIQQ
jgi:hypothetical protein